MQPSQQVIQGAVLGQVAPHVARKVQVDVAPHAVRGLTTLQLLELATLATVNLLTANDRKAIAEKRFEAVKHSENGIEKNYAKNLRIVVTQHLQPALQNYIRSKGGDGNLQIWFEQPQGGKAVSNSSLMRRLIGQDHFIAGNKASPLRSSSESGKAIERHRSYIYSYLTSAGADQQTNGAALVQLLGNQTLYPYISTPSQPKLDLNNGKSVLKALTTSWSHGRQNGAQVKHDFALVMKAVRATLLEGGRTQPGQEPEDPERGGRSTAPYTNAARVEITNAGSGFLNDSVATFLANAAQRGTRGNTTAEFFGQVVRQAISQKVGGPNGAQLSGRQAAAAILQLAVRQDYAAVQDVYNAAISVQNIQTADQRWAAVGNSQSLNTLLSDLGMPRSMGSDNKKLLKFSYEVKPGQAATDQSVKDAKAIFEGLHQKYLSVVQSAQNEKRSPGSINRKNARLARPPTVARGVMGADDKSITAIMPGNPDSALRYVKYALQGRYSKSALVTGAQKLGIQGVNVNSLNYNLPLQQLVEGILEQYRPGFNAIQPDPASVRIVATALGVAKAAKARNTDAVALAKRGALNKMDAARGVLSEQCPTVNGAVKPPPGLTGDDLKRIAKAHNHKSKEAKNNTELCALLQGALDAPVNTIDDAAARVEQTREAPKSSGVRKSSGRRAPSQPIDLNSRLLSNSAVQGFGQGPFQPVASQNQPFLVTSPVRTNQVPTMQQFTQPQAPNTFAQPAFVMQTQPNPGQFNLTQQQTQPGGFVNLNSLVPSSQQQPFNPLI